MRAEKILVLVLIRRRLAAVTDGSIQAILLAMVRAGDARCKSSGTSNALRKVARTM